jgi:16S rRNA (guanine(527)-N(7))-methyltransferase RsmG
LSFNADMEASSESVQESVGEEIDALGARYELADGAGDALRGLVGLVDWGEPNFVPRADPSSRKRERRRPPELRSRIASNVVAESLAGLELKPVREARRLADIGSGAGFPGMVLAIALPQARVALIEKIPEKCDFLRRTVAELGLDNVEVVEGAVQRWSEGVGACDVVTARKVQPPATMAEWSKPLLAPGGAVVLWPGRTDFPKEVIEADTSEAGLRLAEVHSMESKNRHGEPIVKNLYLYLEVDES